MYLYLKSFHVVAVISWMAGLLYLFRLFVYHAQYGQTSRDKAELLELMEAKLYKIITIPAMLFSWALGLSLIHFNTTVFSQGWFHTKLFALILLTGVTHYGGALIKKFKKDISLAPSHKTLRMINEIPTVLMIIIVIMVIARPF
jgi:putative membrane protein